jgi:uncharacterized membrane protein YjjP (DUF1212 family)/uncharacterized membrane protein YjjB (DUF3815 family)
MTRGPSAERDAVQFVVALAGALSRAGAAEGIVQPRASAIAIKYGVPDARVVLLPNLTLAAERRGSPVELDTAAPSDSDLRLDQIAAVERLARLADRARVTPREGLRQLEEIKSLPHRFGEFGMVAGHAVISVGLCLVLQPTLPVLVMAAVFGGVVGVLKLAAHRSETLSVLLPITAATLVSAVAFLVVPDTAGEQSVRALIPPLVTFLPGGMITTATLDLAAGHLISGSTRLVAGAMQLALLMLGIAIGVGLAGSDVSLATADHPANSLGAWAPWLGAAVFGVGCWLHFSGPRRSLGWLLVVVLSAWAGEFLGARLVSDQLGAFTGALLVTPIAASIERRPTGPPSLATMLPAFWLLVPGATGLIGVAQFVGSRQTAAPAHFVDAFVTFILIGLGVFLGNALVLRTRATRAARRASLRAAAMDGRRR